MAKRWSFEEWMAVIDSLAVKKTGLDTSDLPDMPYRDWYEDGMAPSSAANKAVKNASE